MTTTDTQQFIVVYSDNDLIDEEDQNRLMFWRDAFRNGQFDIGDIANRQCMRSAEKGFPATQDRIFEAVGNFCGKSKRTIRYYCEAARFYPKEVREKYDIVPFSHYVLARMFADWQAVLDYSMAHPNISEDRLRSIFQTTIDQGGCEQDVLARVAINPGVSAGDYNYESSSVGVLARNITKSANVSVVNVLSGVLEQLETILKKFRLKPETAGRAADLMAEFRALIPKILDEINTE